MSAPINPWISVVDRLRGNQSAVGASLSVATQKPLAEGLEALRLSNLTGIPSYLIDNPAETERVARNRDVARGEIAKSPFLQKFLSTPPNAAAYLFVEPELLALRDALHTPPSARENRAFKREQSELNLEAGAYAIRHALRTLSPEEEATYQAIQSRRTEDPDLARDLGLDRGLLDEIQDTMLTLQTGGSNVRGAERSLFYRVSGAVAGQIPNLTHTMPRVAAGVALGGAAGAIIGGGAGAIAGPEGIVPGIVTGARVGAKVGALGGTFVGSFEPELAASLDEFERAATLNPEPPSHETVVGAAVLSATFKAGLDTASLAVLFSKVPGLGKLFDGASDLGAKQILAAVGKDKLSATILERFGTAWMQSVAAEAFTEPVQEYADIIGAALVADKPLWESLKEGTPRAGEAMAEAVLATGVLGAVAPSWTAIRDQARGIRTKQDLINRSEASEKHLNEIVKRADSLSKLRESAPSAHQELAQGVAAESGQPDVFIAPGKLLELWGATGERLDALPAVVKQQVGDALATGRDLVIPTGEWLTTFAPKLKESAQGLVRLGPDLLDPEERKALTDEVEAEIKDLALWSDTPEGATPIVGDPQLFGSAEDAGMTRNEYEVYTRLRDEVTELKRGRLDDAKVRELARRRGLVSRVLRARDRVDAEARAAIRKEVEASVNATPVWRAAHFLRTGEWRGESVIRGKRIKLDRDQVLKMFGTTPFTALAKRLGGVNRAEQVKAIPLGSGSWLTAEDGIHPDAIAEQLGFASGKQLVEALLDAGAIDAKSSERVIEAETERRVRAAEGAPPGETEIALLRSTLEDDFQIDRLVMDEKALSKKSNKTKGTPRKVLQVVVDRIMRNSVPEMMRPELYRAAAERARFEARQALKEGNYDAAAAGVRREMLNRMLSIAAVEARHEKEAIRRDVKKRITSRNIRDRIGLAGEDWLAQWDGLVERVDLRKRTHAQRESLKQFIESKSAEDGADLLVPEWLIDAPRAFQDLTLDEARGFKAAVASVQNAALRTLEVKLQGKAVELEAAADSIVFELSKMQSQAVESPRIGERTGVDEARRVLRILDAVTTRKEALAAVIGQARGPMGAVMQTVIRPLHDAQETMDEWTAKITEHMTSRALGLSKEEYRALHEPLVEDRLSLPPKLDPLTGESPSGGPATLTRWDLWAILANLGNASNEKKLLEGNRWNRDVVLRVLEDHLTEKDVRDVEKMWAVAAAMKEESFASYARRYGVEPESIVPTPITVKGITLSGGYWPVVFDPRYSRTGQKAFLADDLDAQHTSPLATVQTTHNFTISRTEATAPLLLSMDRVLLKHLDEVLRDLAFGETLIDVSRILKHPRVDAAMQQVLGQEFGYANFWRPYLAKIKGDSVNRMPEAGMAILEKAVPRWTRFSVGIFTLAGNATSYAVQPGSLINAVNVISQHSKLDRAEISRRLEQSVRDSVGSFNGARAMRVRESVHAVSGFMRHRVFSSSPDYRDMVRQLRDHTSWSEDRAEQAMRWMAEVQYHTADLPTWIAAHRIALEEKGLDGDDAVFFADSIVRLAHGAGTKIDVPSFLATDNEWLRLFTMYQNYPNTALSQIRQTYRLNDRTRSDVATAWMFSSALPFAWYTAVSALVAIGSGYEPPWLKSPLRLFGRLVGDVAGLVPGGSAVASLATEDRPRDPSAVGVLAREGSDFLHPTDAQDFFFDALRMVMLVKRIPGAPVVRTTERAIQNSENSNGR